MPIHNEPRSIETILRDLERRLHAVENANPARFTTITEGSTIVKELDGTILARFGNFNGPDMAPAVGVSLYDSDGRTVLAIDGSHEGLHYPHIQAGWTVPTAQSITSGAFVTVAEAGVYETTHDCFFFQAAIVVPGATTAEVRVHDASTGVDTNVLTVGAGASGTVTCQWIHPFSIGWGDTDPDTAPLLQYQVRRASGAGTISAFPPRQLVFVNRSFLLAPSGATPLTFA